MELKVLFSEDPAFVLMRADEFLSSKAVVHNLILSILHARVARVCTPASHAPIQVDIGSRFTGGKPSSVWSFSHRWNTQLR
jgi:hypothetical protein